MGAGNNYGLNNDYHYNEYEFDSLDASASGSASVSPQDWPVFLLGGKNPVTNIAAIKILEVQIPFSYYVFVPENTTQNANSTQWTLNETGIFFHKY